MDFSEGIDRLHEMVPHRLSGQVEVDQVYAHYQHEGLDLKHPHGGQAKYLEAPLYAGADQFVQHLADAVLDDGVETAMVENVENLAAQVVVLAPVDMGPLHDSAHPSVTSDGVVVYDRPPTVPRLSESELRALHHGGHKHG